jgi:hypothetical protein
MYSAPKNSSPADVIAYAAVFNPFHHAKAVILSEAGHSLIVICIVEGPRRFYTHPNRPTLFNHDAGRLTLPNASSVHLTISSPPITYNDFHNQKLDSPRYN